MCNDSWIVGMRRMYHLLIDILIYVCMFVCLIVIILFVCILYVMLICSVSTGILVFDIFVLVVIGDGKDILPITLGL